MSERKNQHVALLCAHETQSFGRHSAEARCNNKHRSRAGSCVTGEQHGKHNEQAKKEFDLLLRGEQCCVVMFTGHAGVGAVGVFPKVGDSGGWQAAMRLRGTSDGLRRANGVGHLVHHVLALAMTHDGIRVRLHLRQQLLDLTAHS